MARVTCSKQLRLSLALALKAVRERHGLTLERFAERVGASRATVWRNECAKSNDNVSLYYLEQVAKFDGCELSDLFAEAEMIRDEKRHSDLLSKVEEFRKIALVRSGLEQQED